MFHFCGNPLHDIPLYLMLAAPFLAPIVLWLRARLSRCDCGHDHSDGSHHAK
jgi:hypothetical protein